jgi:hypothetical protein
MSAFLQSEPMTRRPALRTDPPHKGVNTEYVARPYRPSKSHHAVLWIVGAAIIAIRRRSPAR